MNKEEEKRKNQDALLSFGSAQKKRALQYEKWRWEFMRRSPEYLAAWENVKELRGKAEFPPGYRIKEGNTVEYPYWGTPQAEEERKYCAEFDLSSPSFPDPSKSYEDLIGYFGWHLLFAHRINLRAVRLSYKIKNPNHVTIDIDLEKVNSIPALKKRISELLEHHLDILSRRGRPFSKSRFKREDYEKILRVGDLKKQPGYTDEAIAAEEFKERYHRKPDATRRQVNKFAKEYENLTEKGGWRKITFP